MFASNTSQVSSDATYIEDVFSTYLYTGNGSSQTITNGIDLAGKGGLVWLKSRTANGAPSHYLVDTVRGPQSFLFSNLTWAASTYPAGYFSFLSNGFNLNDGGGNYNVNAINYASWTFRKQPKFFDVVTWTGDGTSNRQISHSLGSTPGCVIVKNTSSASDWPVYHRSLGFSTGGAPYNGLRLNGTNAVGTYDPPISAASSTTITVTTSGSNTNQSGQTFVAYLFAHDAGGFGTAGTDNVISCGSVTMPGAGGAATVTLGWEPQWVLMKDANHTGGAQWLLIDNMRGWPASGSTTANTELLRTYNSDAESGATYSEGITSTGFQVPSNFNYADDNTKIIYIAIRRGPMKTPTSGTSVFAPVTRTAPSTTVTSNTNPDLLVAVNRNTAGYSKAWLDKLRGKIGYVASSDTATEYSGATATLTDWGNTGVKYNSSAGAPANDSGVTYVDYYFTRAPGFFDEVCYSGTGVTAWINHNLTVPPELIILKNRTVSSGWLTYAAPLGADKYLQVNSTAGSTTSTIVWDNTTPTSTQFRVYNGFNNSGYNYVGYLFASCPGVSKVGSYTGTAGAQTISCGFAARFVLIKRTDSTGNWWVWDTARGMVAGTDPRSPLNTTAAENNANWVYTDASGFQIVTTDATVNASGGTYIYLAIA